MWLGLTNFARKTSGEISLPQHDQATRIPAFDLSRGLKHVLILDGLREVGDCPKREYSISIIATASQPAHIQLAAEIFLQTTSQRVHLHDEMRHGCVPGGLRMVDPAALAATAANLAHRECDDLTEPPVEIDRGYGRVAQPFAYGSS